MKAQFPHPPYDPGGQFTVLIGKPGLPVFRGLIANGFSSGLDFSCHPLRCPQGIVGQGQIGVGRPEIGILIQGTDKNIFCLVIWGIREDSTSQAVESN